MIKIDGSQGEGGGQILRTALSLSALTQQPIEINNIRAGRAKPGLMRQHLTSLQAAAQINCAKIEGAAVGSTRITFKPTKICAGDFHFKIGTAGSTTLVCQTLLPILLAADQASTVTFEGGTHNGMSPSLTFLQDSFLPLLKQMGVKYNVTVDTFGFYPAGGGKWQLKISPIAQLEPFSLVERAQATQQQAIGIVSRLPLNILEREFTIIKKQLDWHQAKFMKLSVDAPGPGNALLMQYITEQHCTTIESTGKKGISAEAIAKKLSKKMRSFIQSQACVDSYLADQLLLPMALAGTGEFSTPAITEHTKTNIAIIEQMTDIRFSTEKLHEHFWYVGIK
ncbi:MAG: RNA 3'-terminal phosphate cyclase [Pseudomonadota bacterium]